MNKIYYFGAEWCGPCKMFKPTVKSVASAKLVNIEYVDVDTSPLASQYGITSIPTMIVADAATGQEKKRKSGVMSTSQLIDFIS